MRLLLGIAVALCLSVALVSAQTFTPFTGVITHVRQGVIGVTHAAIAKGDGVLHTLTYNSNTGAYEHCQLAEPSAPGNVPICFVGTVSTGWDIIQGVSATDGGVHWLFADTMFGTTLIWTFSPQATPRPDLSGLR